MLSPTRVHGWRFTMGGGHAPEIRGGSKACQVFCVKATTKEDKDNASWVREDAVE
jgi:hypothetical protein